MIVEVKLFAAARQAADAAVVNVELPPGATVGELRKQLLRQCPTLAAWKNHLLVAVDEQFAADSLTLVAGQEVACFPPVSGG